MAILNFEGRRTPIEPRKILQPALDLEYLWKELQANPTPRDYACIPDTTSTTSSPSGPRTPPFADPLHPVEYFRSLCEIRLQILWHDRHRIEYRESINDWVYWSIEVEFLSQDVPCYEQKREQISDSRYWKCEAKYWRKLHQGKVQGDRFDIPDYKYWRIELELLRQLPETRAKERRKIPSEIYWQIELWHYEDLKARSRSSPDGDAVPYLEDNLQLQWEILKRAQPPAPFVPPTPTELSSTQSAWTNRSKLKRKRSATGSSDHSGTSPKSARNVRRKITRAQPTPDDSERTNGNKGRASNGISRTITDATPSTIDQGAVGLFSIDGSSLSPSPRLHDTLEWSMEQQPHPRDEMFVLRERLRMGRVDFNVSTDPEPNYRNSLLLLVEGGRPSRSRTVRSVQNEVRKLHDRSTKSAKRVSRTGHRTSKTPFMTEQEVCFTDNNERLQRTLATVLFDWRSPSATVNVSFGRTWWTPIPSLPQAERGQAAVVPVPQPYMALCWSLQSLTDDIAVHIPKRLDKALRPDGTQWNCFPFIFVETVGGMKNLEPAHLQNLLSTRQALQNITQWMKEAGRHEDCFEEVRVFSIAMNAHKLVIRCHRVVTGQNRCLEFKHDEETCQIPYREEQVERLVHRLANHAIVQDLHAMLKGVFTTVVHRP